MTYQERGWSPPHFDGTNYQMWQRQMVAFLCDKSQILWDVMVNTTYVHPVNFLAIGSRDMFDANNKVVDYLYRAVCQSEFDRVLLTVYFSTPKMFISLWFGFVYGTNPPLGTLII
jgi:hypothetical protein